MPIPKLSGFLIGLVFVSMFAVLFGLFISEGAVNYGIDNSSLTLNQYNHLTELSNQANEIKDSSTTISQQPGILDVIGGFFYNAYVVLIGIPTSYNFFQSMVSQAALDANLGTGGQYIIAAIETIVLILITIGILLAVLLKAGVL